MIIDAHHHYWQLGRFEYGWLTPANPTLYRDYLPQHLYTDWEGHGVQAAVLVQADASLGETRWMLELAGRHPHIAGVVGWVDLAAPEVRVALADLARHPKFKGVRPDLSAPPAALRDGLAALVEHDLTCDVLARPDQLPHVIALAREQPGVTFVLDHFGGAALTPGGQAEWAEQLRQAAGQPNLTLKVSGYLTAANPRPLHAETLRGYLEAALSLFSSARLMYGSDWPVCLQAGSYAENINVLREAASNLSAVEKADLWGRTAARVYGLENAHQRSSV